MKLDWFQPTVWRHSPTNSCSVKKNARKSRTSQFCQQTYYSIRFVSQPSTILYDLYDYIITGEMVERRTRLLKAYHLAEDIAQNRYMWKQHAEAGLRPTTGHYGCTLMVTMMMNITILYNIICKINSSYLWRMYNNPQDCSKRFTPYNTPYSRHVQLNAIDLAFSGKHPATLQLMREYYPYIVHKCPSLSTAKFSFRQLSELSAIPRDWAIPPLLTQ